ncbi:MAG: nuclear transport factor 2 family protein [Actinobacteria bacterium]|nr:nuclear transport factor 2 family protein [Actinomycetota bacterium]
MIAIDEHRWDDLAQYLHPEFRCLLVHTGEVFTRDAWIRFNAGYPGFERLVVEDLVGEDDASACRSHVTSRADEGVLNFACASFARLRDGVIVELTEVWTDMERQAPAGTRVDRTAV